ncbi:MAG: NAD(P)H-dependent oxidoreductase subunit E [Clostridia bacterium]|nr:NAD(P)H-dependent oxidoreductase subunit E [Clostridia bacterium]
MTPVETAQRKFRRVNEIIEVHGHEQAALVPILQEVQAEYRYLPEEILTYISTAMRIPAATVFGVATFYAQFSLEPKGKYLVRCCDGTACHVRNSKPVYDAIRAKVGLTDGKFTTPDLKFTVETVSCLGACGLAPVITINNEVHGKMTPEAAAIIIDTLLKRDGDN